MKKKVVILPILAILFITGCKRSIDERSDPPSEQGVPKVIMDKIKANGYSTYNVIPFEDGYIVEGDIFLDKEFFESQTHNRSVFDKSKSIIIDAQAHYRTNNKIVLNGPTGRRNVIVNMPPEFPTIYHQALDVAKRRFNNAGFRLSFTQVSTNPANYPYPIDINFQINNNLPSGVLGRSGGWPTSSGNFSTTPIQLSTNTIGPNPDVNYLATILAHEIGHMMGFRHTDYFDRSLSGCPYVPELPNGYNEGDAGVGAIHIPGTPTGFDAESWMLACIPNGVNRPFTPNDILALQNLFYP